MKLMSKFLVLAGVAIAASCGTTSERTRPTSADTPILVRSTYNEVLAFNRDLPYPRVEKLMDRYGGGAAGIWVRESRHTSRQIPPGELQDSQCDTVIEYNIDVFGMPKVNDIRKRVHLDNGHVLERRARITALGQLISEEIREEGQMTLARGWYLNGRLAYEQTFEKGRADGPGFDLAPDGKILQQMQWVEGKCMQAWDAKGIQTVIDGNGTISRFNWYFGDGENAGTEWYIDGEYDRGAG